MQIFCLKVQKKTTTPLLMGSRQTTNHTKKDALQRLLWVTSGARTHDTRNHNPMLCQLSYSHHVASFSKAGAKVLQKMHMCKFFVGKNAFLYKK